MSAPEPEQHPAWQEIEPAANAMRDPQLLAAYPPGEHAIELSKAISLKRIADALAPAAGESVSYLLMQIALNGIPRQ